ncbi:MAG: N-6 DNA methylase [Candidatus Aminicenantes bacterium]|nr:MAG: N-6 DNA methylase [Candidatus Aminicenantes bacterium]
MIKDVVSKYLTDVYNMFSSGEAREESYYPALERFILKIRDLIKRPDLEIISVPKKTEAGNPDFVIKAPGTKTVGYIEAKAPTKKLADVEDSPQINRYREVFPNLILTNFLEFRLYRYGKLINSICIDQQVSLVKGGIKPLPQNEEKCLELFKDYLSYILPNHINARWLAVALANRTRLMRDYVVMEELKTGPGSKAKGRENHILGFYHAFKKYLIHDLTKKDFADLYSQTLTFGLFTAATRCKGKLKRESAINYIPTANGILHDMFQFISIDKVPQQLKCSMDDIVHLINLVDANCILYEYFIESKGEDPIHHFYETFLSEYDPRVREKRGVYYTPRPVVFFIVKSIHLILKIKLKRSDGLADPGIKILDPAAGTATFLAEAAQLAIEEYMRKYGQGTKEDFVGNYKLNNLYGFELMMAPYAMAYLKMAYILDRIGGRLEEEERFNIYLTNALEMEDIEQSNLPCMSTMSGESRLAGKIKKKTPITVILGNPPYAGHSLTKSETIISRTTRTKRIKYQKVKTWIGEQIEAYKLIDGKPLPEKNLKWLQDDYVKFIRFAQVKIQEKGEGVVGLVTNHAYLDNPTFRGMRRSLMESFNEIYILNLHGNVMKKEKCPDGSIDENVFDIRQGVAISLFIKIKNEGADCKVFYADLWGPREDKYAQLGENNILDIQWKRIFPTPGFYLFTPAAAPESETRGHMYQRFYKVTDIFPVHSVGIVTARDKLTVKKNEEEMYNTILAFSKVDEAFARLNFRLGDDTRDWQVKAAQKDVLESGIDRKRIVPILYRPFDIRYTYYTGISRGFICMPRPDVMKHMLQENIGLITVRQVAEGVFNHCLAADTIVESRVTTSNKGIAYIFPLYVYLYPNRDKRGLFNRLNNQESMPRQLNINPKIFNLLREMAGFDPLPSAEQVFYYIYAVLFSTLYREMYAEYLKIDFPRVPFISDYDLFVEVARWGERLTAIHLMKAPELDQTFSKFEVSGDNRVERIRFEPAADQGGRVYINNCQYFSHISPDIWEYETCGYQVMDKWLKSRKNSTLSCKDMKHYIKIARCLELTIQYQQKIDQLYPSLEKSLIVT